ncbi:putative nuclease HARBI1 [Macrosteles quadrilineatus]|uniref:putative nuclease HARBI1 n=1 Tax=Macrosteles quadrilineatus TaxID=74068 RepID=UPI0023E1D58E|nr:putative nuclease HARBI1 [Macrosteles quadrilineatus]XP_054287728.1 putative nuclease HARBI1 [Macrosteles quadrilineatus]
MEYLDYLDYVRIHPPRIPGRYRNFNPLNDLSEEEFRDRFRLSKDAVNELIELLTPRLRAPDPRGPHGIPIWKKVLIALRFFAVGSFHRETGDLLDCGESTACQIVHKVALAICLELKREYIKFPSGDYATETKNSFYNKYGFPGVLSCIDGTHIPIVCPATPDKEEYRNRKGFFSINVLAAAGAELEFTFIVARWKGSTHDSRVFKNSSLYANFEERDMGGLLIGDSGYECNRFLMTPLLNPVTPAQGRYQRALVRTRSSVERMFGLFKNRFRCLHNDNTLRFSPRRCCIIIVACAVLHNFGIRRALWQDVVDPLDDVEAIADDPVDENDLPAYDLPEGILSRNDIIRRHFS